MPKYEKLYPQIQNLTQTLFVIFVTFCKSDKEWVNLSKRGGKDGVFQGLAGMLQGISIG